MTPETSREAAKLLAFQFANHEPLSRNLMISQEFLIKFFNEMIRFVLKDGLSSILEDTSGNVVAVVIVQDEQRLFVPRKRLLSESSDGNKIALIGAYLERLKLPKEIQDRWHNKIYYCELMAMSQEHKKSPAVARIMVETYRFLWSKGYRCGYAKVSNPAILKAINRIERTFHQSVLKVHDEITSDALPAITLVTW